MAQSFASPSVEPPHKPEDVARRDFPVVRRGYDQMQVRAFLSAVASALRMAHTREAELRSRLASAVKRAHEAEKLDEATLTRRLGDETVRVLDTAREAAASIMANAEDRAATLVADAQERAAGVEEAAAVVLAERTAEAEAAAESIAARAEEILAEAEDRATELVASARREGEELVADARLAREHILRDMDRRRRTARAQVERLKAGRDKLLESFDVVQGTLDDATSSLHGSLRDAKYAADNAARRVVESRPPEAAELEAEVEAARLAGIIPNLADVPAEDAPPPEVSGNGRGAGARDPSEGDGHDGVVAVEDPGTDPKADLPEPVTPDGVPGADQGGDADRAAATEGAVDEAVVTEGADDGDAATPDAVDEAVITEGAVDGGAAGPDDGGDLTTGAASGIEVERYEPRLVALDPHERGGRRLKRPPVSPAELSPSDLQTVALGDPVEEVSVIGAAATPVDESVADPVEEPVVDVTDVADPVEEPVVDVADPVDESVADVADPVDEPVADVADVADPVEEPVVEEPVVEEPVVDVADVADPVEEPVVDVADPVDESVADVADPVEEPVADPVEGDSVGGADPAAGTADAVDDLFARMRRDREQAVSAARETLAVDPANPVGDLPDDVAARCETVARRLKRVLAEDQNRVLDGIRRNGDRRGSPTIGMDDVLPGADEQLGEYLGAIVAHVTEHALPPAAEDRLGAILRRDLVAPLREVVEAALGEEPDQAAEELRGRFRLAKNEWIPPLAERLVVRAGELTGLDSPL